MTDRELLELAAKAAGYDVTWLKDSQFIHDGDDWWDPLTDDGHALRLAVRLQISIENECVSAGCAYCTKGDVVFEPVYSGGDGSGGVVDADLSAVRRAIVIAAASIGKDMQ